MKVRNGFVSNSSSSSFVLIGRELTDNDLKLSILKSGNILKAVGHYLSEGVDVIDIDSPEKLGFVKAANKLNTNIYEKVFTVYESYFMGEDLTVDVEKLKDKLPERGEVGFYSIEEDYHGCTTLEDMFNSYSNSYRNEGYPSRKEIEREMQVFLRAKKLKKLNKEQKND